MSALKNKKKLLTMNSRGLWNHLLNAANQIWLASSDGPANLLDRGEQSINIAPCSSSRHAFFDRISRDACKQGSGCNINYFNFFKKLFMNGDLVCHINTTNIHKLCSNNRFVIWLARAHWQHRKLKPMSCWEFQSLTNLVIFTSITPSKVTRIFLTYLLCAQKDRILPSNIPVQHSHLISNYLSCNLGIIKITRQLSCPQK